MNYSTYRQYRPRDNLWALLWILTTAAVLAGFRWQQCRIDRRTRHLEEQILDIQGRIGTAKSRLLQAREILEELQRERGVAFYSSSK
jgi:hypothetical protein